MVDAVRLSAEDFQWIYEQSFKTWSTLHHAATKEPGLPPSYLDLRNTFHQHPSFPRNLRLDHIKYPQHSQVYATGRSAWTSTQPNPNHECGLPAFDQQIWIGVALRNPIPVSIAAAPELEVPWASWFARGDQNYLSVLTLAWAYILSARWAEIMPEGASLVYTDNTADDSATDAQTVPLHDHKNLEVDIGDAGSDEARWWAAVLSPGRGWQATMTSGQTTFFAPCSIQLQPGCRFTLKSTNSASPSGSVVAPSFSESLRFLGDFCVRHGITDQSQAALAAVLLFPSMGNNVEGLQLPALATSRPTRVDCYPDVLQQQRLPWTHPDDHLDRLITLSCHVKGIRPLLLSSFYEPNIECNAVTPWLKGALGAIDTLAQDSPLVLGRMLMDRQPKVAPLWLGATVLGLQKRLLQDVGFGLIPIDLHSTAWSGTMQSFIQQPVSDPLVTDDGHVSRADQCRLLYLSRIGSHDRVPICQWRPFGGTPLEHCDLEVRIHVECKGHGLRYQGFTWECVDGNVTQKAIDGGDADVFPEPPQTRETGSLGQIPVSRREEEGVSENATRSIFGWLRVDGHALDEKEIWGHEWLEEMSDEEVYE